MGRQAAAQAQAQEQTTISYTESLELVRCLLRVSIFHVSFLRGLFPDDKFKGVDMKNLEGMHIKMLMPACDESKRLIEWVEHGVYDAIKKGFCKSLFFGVSSDPEGTDLLEEYIFSFTYGEDGQVAMEIAASNKMGGKAAHNTKEAKATVNTVRYQVVRLMRMLVQICQTLDKIPTERYLFMKLTYHEHTPEDYEPPKFVAADSNSVGHFRIKPFSMKVGSVSTEHHQVLVRIKSVLDACDQEDVGSDEGERENMDGEVSASNAGAGADGMMVDEDEVHDGKEVPEAKPAPAAPSVDLTAEPQLEEEEGEVEAPSKALDGKSKAGPALTFLTPEMAEAYDRVRSFSGLQSQLDLTDLMCQFMDIPTSILELFIKQMEADGLVSAMPGRDTYQVLERINRGSQVAEVTPIAAPDDQVADMMTKKLNGLTVGDAKHTHGGEEVCCENEALVTPARTPCLEEDSVSRNSGMAKGKRDPKTKAKRGDPKTKATSTARAPSHKRTLDTRDADPLPAIETNADNEPMDMDAVTTKQAVEKSPALYCDASQPSPRKAKARKTSFVAEPIHQSAKKPRGKGGRMGSMKV